MTEPTIICPSCKSEIKLTESLAAPLIEATRRQYEQKIAQKEAEVTKREAALSEQKAAVERAKETIDEQVEAKVKSERERIAAAEAKKAPGCQYCYVMPFCEFLGQCRIYYAATAANWWILIIAK